MANIRFTFLGMKGSGKTCYLLGMYYKMAGGLKGYTIASEDEQDVELKKRYEILCDSSRGADRFPAGTDDVGEYNFELQYGYKHIMSFDWIDYPGDLIKYKKDFSDVDYQNLSDSIMKSSTLFICVDGDLLVDGDEEDKISAVQDNCSNSINNYLTRYRKVHNDKLPPIAIVVTKVDKCKESTSAEEIEEIIKEAFSPLFVSDSGLVAIIPVSIGLNISSANYTGNLKPENIHLPIFIGVAFGLQEQLKMDEIEDNKKCAACNAIMQNIRDERNSEASSFWLWRSDSKIRSLDEKMKNLDNDFNKEQEERNNRMALRKSDFERLLKELEKVSTYEKGETVNYFGEIRQCL